MRNFKLYFVFLIVNKKTQDHFFLHIYTKHYKLYKKVTNFTKNMRNIKI